MTTPDFKNKPEGATHFSSETLKFYRYQDGVWLFWDDECAWKSARTGGSYFSDIEPIPEYAHRQYIGELLTLSDKALEKLRKKGLIKWRLIAEAYRDGDDIQFFDGEWITEEPVFDSNTEYRIKPKTIKGEIEIAADAEVGTVMNNDKRLVIEFKSVDERNNAYQSITKLLTGK